MYLQLDPQNANRGTERGRALVEASLQECGASRATSTAPWRNRITGSGTLKVCEALANPVNFRLHPAHQRQALAASLDTVGWVQQVVVNTRTGKPIDGHLRLSLAEQRGENELPCLYVDLAEDEERLILASLDPIAAMASADREKLQELLASHRQ